MTLSGARDWTGRLLVLAGALLAAGAGPAAGQDETNALDRSHDWLYHTAHETVAGFDSWLAPAEGPARDVPPSRFRVGVFGECRWEPDHSVTVEPIVEFDARIKLPNIEERLHLFLTTLDPADLPGSEVLRERLTPRLGVGRRWLENIDTAAGVKLQWLPKAYAKLTWSPCWYRGDWMIYPHQKAYWESDDGIGEVTSLVIDHWLDRWDVRSTSSLKWSEKLAKDDEREGIEPRGWQWSQVFMLAHAQELLDECEIGRVVSGEDLARGGGVRVTLQGRPDYAERIRVTPFYKWPLYRRWLYGWVEPEILWERETEWAPGYAVRIGVEALFWGDTDR